MPEHLKALVVILILATTVFVAVRHPVCAMATSPSDFARRRNSWFAITGVAFLASDFWIYMVATASLLFVVAPRDRNKLALFFALLFAVPPVPVQIGGFGLVQYLFALSHPRILTLAVLLPAFILLSTQSDGLRFGKNWPDRLLVGYLCVNFAVMLSATTFTDALRHGVFYAFIDVYLPYYVASRSLRRLEDFRDALSAFVVAALLLSVVAVFETLKHWLLYTAVVGAMDTPWGYGKYLTRGTIALRAQATTGQPIALGFVLAVALAVSPFVLRTWRKPGARRLAVTALLAGLFSSLSRGPWLGAVAAGVAYIGMGAGAGRRIALAALAGLVLLSVLEYLPGGQTVLDLLPFIGTVDAGSLDYRRQLLAVTMEKIWENPLFGGVNIYAAEGADQLLQHYGTFIDVVNTYVGILLASGFSGLFLFLAFFASVAAGAFRRLHSGDPESRALGRSLLAALVAVLSIIFTVSSITIVPTLYWCIAGVMVAYANSNVVTEAQPASAAVASLRRSANRSVPLAAWLRK